MLPKTDDARDDSCRDALEHEVTRRRIYKIPHGISGDGDTSWTTMNEGVLVSPTSLTVAAGASANLPISLNSRANGCRHPVTVMIPIEAT